MPQDETHAGLSNGNPKKQDKPRKPSFTAAATSGWTQLSESPRPLHHRVGSKSEVYVGEIGGQLHSTLEIWSGQIGTPLTAEAFDQLPNTLFLGDDSVLLDLSGNWTGFNGTTIANAQMLLAARSDNGTITFCKLVGPADEVGPQRDAFVSFCASVRRAQ